VITKKENIAFDYCGICAVVIIAGISLFFLLSNSDFLFMEGGAQTISNHSYAPLQAEPQIGNNLNDLDILGKLRQGIETVSNITSQAIGQEVQRQIVDLQDKQQQLQETQKMLPQLSLQREQQEIINQLQTLEQIISLPKDQQQKALNQKQQLLNLLNQTLMQEQRMIHASEGQLQTLQQIISLPKDQQQKLLMDIQNQFPNNSNSINNPLNSSQR
jgi:hypothetical protein